MSDRLRVHAQAAASHARVPYSGEAVGAALLLDDGTWTAAPRIENASFPLTIPALQGALALAALAGRRPVAAALSRPITDSEAALLGEATGASWRLDAPDLAVAEAGAPPVLGAPLRLTLDLPPPPDADGATALALAASDRAVVPASGFPVGAVVEDVDGRLVAGANVEIEADWTRGLCAERTALVGAIAAGLGPIRRLAVACAKAPGATPCGGCRQVIAELAPDAEIAIWNGTEAAEVMTPDALLPGAFGGDRLGA